MIDEKIESYFGKYKIKIKSIELSNDEIAFLTPIVKERDLQNIMKQLKKQDFYKNHLLIRIEDLS